MRFITQLMTLFVENTFYIMASRVKYSWFAVVFSTTEPRIDAPSSLRWEAVTSLRSYGAIFGFSAYKRLKQRFCGAWTYEDHSFAIFAR